MKILKNTSRIKRALIAALVLIIISPVSACSMDIGIRVEKTRGGTVLHFGANEDRSGSFDPICLRMLEVKKASSEEVVWKIVRDGEECLLIKSVHLGILPPGFSQEVGFIPLQSGERYAASVIADEGSVTSDEWQE